MTPYKDRAKKRESQRQWRLDRRTAWIAANGPCRRCGSIESLEIDHIDPASKVDHRVWTWSASRRAAELKKCQVLCVTCHLAKTRSEPSTGRRRKRSVEATNAHAPRPRNREWLRNYWQQRVPVTNPITGATPEVSEPPAKLPLNTDD